MADQLQTSQVILQTEYSEPGNLNTSQAVAQVEYDEPGNLTVSSALIQVEYVERILSSQTDGILTGKILNINDNITDNSLLGSLLTVNNEKISNELLGSIQTAAGVDPNPIFITVNSYPSITYLDFLTISGTTLQGAIVSVNGSTDNVAYEPGGIWTALVDLTVGVNNFHIEAFYLGTLASIDISIELIRYFPFTIFPEPSRIEGLYYDGSSELLVNNPQTYDSSLRSQINPENIDIKIIYGISNSIYFQEEYETSSEIYITVTKDKNTFTILDVGQSAIYQIYYDIVSNENIKETNDGKEYIVSGGIQYLYKQRINTCNKNILYSYVISDDTYAILGSE